MSYTLPGYTPDSFDRGMPMYQVSKVKKEVVRLINNNNYFKGIKVKKMTKDIKDASDLLDEANKVFTSKLLSFHATQEKMIADTTRASRSVRESTQKLAEGLARIEKQANFDRLERYVILLERAEAAISSLAELERDGKLEKISSALK